MPGCFGSPGAAGATQLTNKACVLSGLVILSPGTVERCDVDDKVDETHLSSLLYRGAGDYSPERVPISGWKFNAEEGMLPPVGRRRGGGVESGAIHLDKHIALAKGGRVNSDDIKVPGVVVRCSLSLLKGREFPTHCGNDESTRGLCCWLVGGMRRGCSAACTGCYGGPANDRSVGSGAFVE